MKHKPLQIIGIILGLTLIVALVRWRSPRASDGGLSTNSFYESRSNVFFCSKCGGSKWIKADDYTMPSGEVVARYATCSACKGSGVSEAK